MKPFEFMVSESQERMLAVVTPEKLDAAQAVCTKWGLRSTVIGSVTDTGRFVVREGDEVVGDMPAATLAHDAPIYDPAMERPDYLDEVQSFDPATLAHAEDPADTRRDAVHAAREPQHLLARMDLPPVRPSGPAQLARPARFATPRCCASPTPAARSR